jgi:hypothetical protein
MHSLLEPRQRTSSLVSTVSGPSPLDDRCTTGVQGLSVEAIISAQSLSRHQTYQKAPDSSHPGRLAREWIARPSQHP